MGRDPMDIHCGGRDVSVADVKSLAHWPNGAEASLAFMPARVPMQDFTGADPERVNPFVPVDLVIDHSAQVDRFGSSGAYVDNLQWEYRRYRERYALLN